MKNMRISTGIKGLDEILKGGFIPGASYLILQWHCGGGKA